MPRYTFEFIVNDEKRIVEEIESEPLSDQELSDKWFEVMSKYGLALLPMAAPGSETKMIIKAT